MLQKSQNRIARFGPAFLLALFACSVTHGQDVKTNYLPGTDFAKYHTYKWVSEVPGQPVIGGHPDQILDTEIKRSIDSQLAAKGFIKTDDKPDVFVAYQVALGMEKQWTASGWGDRPWGPGGWGTATGTATSSTIPVGALVLHVYDPAAKQSVWIGLATQTLDPSNNPEKNQKKLDKAMQKLLKNFPPKRK